MAIRQERGPTANAAVALVVVVVVVVAGAWYAVSALSGSDDQATPRHPKVTLPTASAARSRPTALDTPSEAAPMMRTLTTYDLGAGPRGPVLHRTTAISPPGLSRLSLALETLEEKPDVPQYRTWWKPGWLGSATHAEGLISVELGDAPATRPPAMDAVTATQSVQQVVYSLQAVTHSHDPVQFTRHGSPAPSVLGVLTTHPIQAQQLVQVMSLMNVLEPSIDEEYFGRKPYTVSGTGNTAHGVVTVRLERDGQVLQTRTGQMSGSGDLGHLYPWHVDLDVSGLAKGVYLVVASGPDPTDPSLTVSDHQPLRLH